MCSSLYFYAPEGSVITTKIWQSLNQCLKLWSVDYLECHLLLISTQYKLSIIIIVLYWDLDYLLNMQITEFHLLFQISEVGPRNLHFNKVHS